MSSDSFYRKLVKGGGLVFLGLIFELGFSFISQVIVARFFGKVDYGAVSLGVTVMGFAVTVSLLGLNKGIGRNYPRFDDLAARRGVLVSAFHMAMPLSIVIGGGIALFAPFLASEVFNDPSVTWVLRIFGLAVPFTVAVRLIVGAVRGVKLSRGKVIVRSITIPLTRFSIVLIVLFFGFGVLGIALAYALAYVVASIVGLYYVYRYTPLFDGTESEPMYRTLLSFSAPLVISATMTKVLSDIDTALLGVFVSTGDIGVYNVVYPLAALLSIPLNAIGFLFLPMISELHANGEREEMSRMYKLVTKWTVLFTIPLLFAILLFPENVIALTFGREYLEGSIALQILSLAFFIPLVAGPNTNVLMSIGSTKQIMYFDTSTAVLNIVLNLWLIPKYSFLGAAAATSIAFILQNVLYSVQVYREIGLVPLSTSLLKPGIASLFLGTALAYLVSHLFTVTHIAFLLVLIVFTLLHGVLIVFFGGIEQEEMMLVLSFEERFGVDLGPVKRLANRLM